MSLVKTAAILHFYVLRQHVTCQMSFFLLSYLTMSILLGLVVGSLICLQKTWFWVPCARAFSSCETLVWSWYWSRAGWIFVKWTPMSWMGCVHPSLCSILCWNSPTCSWLGLPVPACSVHHRPYPQETYGGHRYQVGSSCKLFFVQVAAFLVNEYSTCSYSWSSTPDLGSQRLMRDGLLVKKTSKVLSILVGNDTDCVIPGLDATSIKQLLLLLRYWWLLMDSVVRSMSGRLRSPATQMGLFRNCAINLMEVEKLAAYSLFSLWIFFLCNLLYNDSHNYFRHQSTYQVIHALI